jgi:hypothetical protein
MSNHKDQRGNPITVDKLIEEVCEAVLANVMALEVNGVSRERMKIIVGEDGGTVLVGEFLFQTPIEKKLSKADGLRLFEAFRELLKKYDEGNIDKGRIMEIQEKNNFTHKREVIRKKRDHLN